MNEKIAAIFREMAVLFEMKEIPFKPRAYEHAAFSIESHEADLRDLYKKGGIKALKEISGVGQGIAEKIEEFIHTRHIEEYEKMKKKYPVRIGELLQIEGVGPKGIQKLYEKLKIKTVHELEVAAKKHKVSGLSGFGDKSEAKILNSIESLKKFHGRFLLGTALPIAHRIVERLQKLPIIKKVECAGSLRRWQETIGDLDFLVISHHSQKVMDFFVNMPEVASIIAQGNTKTSVKFHSGMNADVRVVPPESFGAALQYFTGDKYHNVEIRKIAIKKGYKLNEYGLYKSNKMIAGSTEGSVYKALGMSWMPPEMRTNSGEIEIAQKHALPKLIDYDDLRGDLQVQTDWTDGEHSIEEMAHAAKKAGLSYIAITDHTKTLAMTGGSDEKKLKRQMSEIDKIQKKISGFKILKGAEVNILKDGSLDIDDKTLAQLDVVGASVHSHFGMDEKEMTARIVRAMENPNVDIIFHPTGRILEKREPYRVDIDTLIKVTKRTKTILEINAHPSRLDLKDDHIRKAVETGILFSIDSDAHSQEDYSHLKYGIGQARRGWVQKKDVINTRSWDKMLKLLK